MIRDVLVFGGGSAGFIAAVTLKMKLPHLRVRVIRSKEIGVIGVGESTTLVVPKHLHGYLKIPIAEFYREAEPQWKIAVKLEWGPKPWFALPFRYQMTVRYDGLSKEAGYYCYGIPQDNVGWGSALVAQDRAFARLRDGTPAFDRDTAYHLENVTFVAYLEKVAERIGVEIRDEKIGDVLLDDDGVAGLRLGTGEVVKADLYLDCSGFGSVLLGKALKEPYISFSDSLYCDRAVVGGWDRAPGEGVHSHTRAETMECGWCWQIDHLRRINRGYVYSSAFISDSDAEAEFRRKNPRVTHTGLIRFRSGRFERAWVKNVVAIGNAAGFVEPLQSTGLMRICSTSRLLVEVLSEAEEGEVQEASKRAYNQNHARAWDAIRGFLAIHYRFNKRIDNAFWRECTEKADLASDAELVEVFRACGPNSLITSNLLDSLDPFGIEGHLAVLIGLQVPYRFGANPSEGEARTWTAIQDHYRRQALAGVTAEEAWKVVTSPQWNWRPDLYEDEVMDRALVRV